MLIVSNIERLATYDGPGLRTVIYVKGCPLRCRWCSNPETQVKKPQILIKHKSCIACKNCIKVCPKQALYFKEKIIVNHDLCNGCKKCVSSCPTGSLTLNGQKYSVESLLKIIEKDKEFYQTSGGGVTISGGELLSQGSEIYQLLAKCQQLGINTAIETSGYGDPEIFKKILSVTDYLMFDYKLPSHLHLEFTNRNNELIKTNLKYANQTHQNLLVRIPLIPDINTNSEVLNVLINELHTLKIKNIELLKYHTFGLNKYDALNQQYLLPRDASLSTQKFKQIELLFKSSNFNLLMKGE